MSAKEPDINTIIGNVITRSHAIEKLLRTHYKVTGRGLHKAIDDLSDTLPAVLARTIRVVAIARNAAAHPEGFKADTVPPDFDRLCNEIELLIPYFADQQHIKPAQPPKEPKPPTFKPKATNPTPQSQNKGDAVNVPANQGKPWTPEEDKMLTDAFDAQRTVPEIAKAHQRGVGGIQGRLTKLGRLTADQYKTYPPESL